MSTFTCINCCVKFASAELQRDHYKTDWHRYNLKCRVAELPAVSAEAFEERLVRMQQQKVIENEESQMNFYCNACRKQFGNQKAHDNHLNSKKHKENVLRFEKEHKGESVEVTKKCVVQQKPHPALVAAAQGKGKFALQQQQQKKEEENKYEDMDDDDDDDDEDYEVVEDEEVLT